MMPTETDWAWAAGLFEGEGCVRFRHYPQSPHNRCEYMMALCMKDDDVVERFHSVVGAGTIYNDTHEMHNWTTGRMGDIRRIMAAMYPYLGERRRAKWADCLEFRQQWQDRKPIKDPGLCAQCGAHGVRIMPSGQRYCRPCNTARRRVRREKVA